MLLARRQGLLRRRAHVSKTIAPERPAFAHPAFDYENRIATVDVDDAGDLTVASIYVPERRQGLPRQDARSSRRWTRYAASFQASGRPLVLLRRHERGADRTRRASERAQAARDRPAAGGARADRADPRAAAWSTSAARSIPTTTACSPGGRRGATCAQRNIGWRLDYVLASEALAARATACPVQSGVGTSDHAPVVATFSCTLQKRRKAESARKAR